MLDLAKYFDVKKFAEIAIENDFIKIWCGIIFLVLVVSFFYVLYKLFFKIGRQLSGATKKLGKYPTEHEFMLNFEAFNDLVKKDYLSISHAWAEYTENLVFPESDDNESIIRNSKQSSEYFNEYSLIVPNIKISFVNIIPNLLTGFGILGTFVGLAAGIFLASASMTASDMEVVKSGLSSLLGGASLAFLTSIAGLLSSMIFTVSKQILISIVQQRIELWTQEIDKHVQLITVEKIAGRLQNELETQTLQLKTFNTDLATSIANALDEKIAGRLLPGIEKMTETLEGIRSDRGNSTEKLLESVVEEFKKSMSGAAGNQFNSMAETLQHLDTTIKHSVGILKTTPKHAEASTRMMTEGVQKVLEETTRTLKSEITESIQVATQITKATSEEIVGSFRDTAKEAAGCIDDSLSSFKTIVDRFDESTNNISNILIKSGETISRFNNLGEQLSQTHQAVHDSLDSITKTSINLTSLAESTANSFDANQEILATVKQTAETISQSHTSLKRTWDDYQQRFESVDVSLQKVFTEIDQSLLRYTTKIKEFVIELDDQMSKGIGDLSGAIGDLSETVEDLLPDNQKLVRGLR